MTKRMRVASGVSQLDRVLGGLYIGDNVVWHDDAGSLASVFCLNFIQTSLAQKKPFIYVSFDRSPRNLLEKLGPLSEYPFLTILDCFTHGKGAGSDVFLKFYEQDSASLPCGIIQVDKPHLVENVMDAFYGAHGTMEGDVRFVFESLTGMQELWGGEADLLKFYTHSCPRLYELNTIAYWIIEKQAHSPRLRAQINQIAQVAIDLSVRRGITSLTVLKAEGRYLDTLNQPFHYSSKHLNITFDTQKRFTGRIDLGMRLKELRTKRGLSQTELAKRVGVTPSTISQVESNSIYPSLPALLKMAEILAVEVNSFFQGAEDITNRVVFPAGERVEVKFPDLPAGSINARLLTPLDFDLKAESYLIEIPGKKSLSSHFFIHKGEEMGYLLSGKLRLKFQKGTNTIQEGDTVYLTTETPIQWTNPGPDTAQLLWIKIK